MKKHIFSISLVIAGINIWAFGLMKTGAFKSFVTETITNEYCSTPDVAVHFDLNDCEATIGSTDMDYSEFTASYSENSCANFSVIGNNLYRVNPTVNKHSCTPGVFDSPAMCVDALDNCTYQAGSEKSVRFDIVVTPLNNETVVLGGLLFYEKAPLTFDWIGGIDGINNPPSLYGLRVLKNGVPVFESFDLPTESEWNLESFDFSEFPEFMVSEQAAFSFELLGYCIQDNGGMENVWDLDEISIISCCGECEILETSLSTNDETDICLQAGENAIINFEVNNDNAENTVLIKTNEQGDIIELIENSSSIVVNEDSVSPCFVYAIGYTGTVLGLLESNNIDDLAGCFSSSDAIELVINTSGEAATISVNDLPVICNGDLAGQEIVVDIEIEDNLNYQLILVDEFGNVLANSDSNVIIIPDSQVDSCFITLISSSDPFNDLEFGDNLTDLAACVAVSNQIKLEKTSSSDQSDFTVQIEACPGDDLEIVLTDITDELLDDSSVISWSWLINSGSDVFNFDTPVVNISLPNQSATISLTVELDNGCTITTEKTFEESMLPEVKAYANYFLCSSESGILELFYDLDSSLISLVSEIEEVEWIVSTAVETETYFGQAVTVTVPIEPITDIQASIIFENGCVIDAEIVADSVVVDGFNFEIIQEVVECTENDFVIQFSNAFNFDINGIPIDYAWEVNKNGTIETFTTSVITVRYQEGDSICVNSTVAFGGDQPCEVSKKLDFVPSSLVPELEIVYLPLDCNNGLQIEVDLLGDENLPDGFSISEIDWSVTQNDVTIIEDQYPFIVSLNAEDEVVINASVIFENGCGVELFKIINPEELEGQADFEISFNPCEAIKNAYTITLNNTNIVSEADIDSTVWEITIDGDLTVLNGAAVSFVITTNSVLHITQQVYFSNNCVIFNETTIDPFGGFEEPGFEVSDIVCTNNAYELELTAVDLVEFQDFNVESINWEIQNNNISQVLEGAVVNFSVVPGDIIVVMTVHYSNGCSYSTEQNITDIVLPEINVEAAVYGCGAEGFLILLDEANSEDGDEVAWAVNSVDGQSVSGNNPAYFFVSDTTGIEIFVEVSFQSGCVVNGTTSLDSVSAPLSLEIEAEVSSCDDDDYTISLTNNLGMDISMLPVEYLWTINKNGIDQTFTTAELDLVCSPGDSVNISSMVNIGDMSFCALEDDLFLDVESLLPDLEIVYNTVTCSDNIEIEIDLIGEELLFDGFEIINIDWSVTQNNVTVIEDTHPFVISVMATDEAVINASVDFANGCSIELFRIIMPSELQGQAEFTMSYDPCQAINGVYELTLSNINIQSQASIDSTVWTITIDGSTSSYFGSPIEFDINAGSSLEILQQVYFSNGCIATNESNIDPFGAFENPEFEIASVECVNGVYDMHLQAANLIEFNGFTIESINWEIENNGLTQFLTGETINISVNAGELLVNLTITYSNGCEYTIQEDISNEVAPELNLESSIFGCGNEGFLILLNETTIELGDVIEWTINSIDGQSVSNENPAYFFVSDTSDVIVMVDVSFASGCDATETIDINGDAQLIDLNISAEVSSCDDDDYTIALENQLSFDLTGLPVEYNWSIIKNGQVENFNTELLELTCSPGDSVFIISQLNIGSMEFCMLEDQIFLDIESLLPDLEIVYTPLSCDDDITIEIDLEGEENLFDGFEIINIDWSVTTNQVTTIQNDHPFVITVSEGDEVLINASVDFVNGCSRELFELLTFDQIFAQSDFGLDFSPCDPDDGIYNISLYDDSDTSIAQIVSIEWTVVIDGETFNFNGPMVDFELSENFSLYILQEVQFDNGCTGLKELSVENFADYLQPDISFQLLSCQDDMFNLLLSGPDSNYIAGLTVVNYIWQVQTDEGSTIYNGQEIEISVDENGAFIVLDVELSNGCTLRNEMDLTDGLIPGLEITASIFECEDDNKILVANTVFDNNQGITIVNVDWTFTGSQSSEELSANPAQFDVTTNIPISLEALVTLSNGCSITQTIDQFDEIQDLEIYIIGELISCQSDNYEIEFTADFADSLGLTPMSYLWSILVNGSTIEGSEENITVNINATDTISVYLEIDFGLSCTASADLIATGTDFLPEYEISASLLDCAAENLVQLELLEISQGFVIENEQWTIQSSQGVSNFNESPVEILLMVRDTAFVSVELEFTNGCSKTISDQIIVDDILPVASYQVSFGSCIAVDGLIEVNFENTTIVSGASVQSVNWNIVSGSEVINSEEDPFITVLPVDSTTIVNLTVLFDNGCQASLSDTLETIMDMVSPEINYEILSCEDDGFLISLMGIAPETLDSSEIASWNWTIQGPNGTEMYAGQNVTLEFENASYEIILELTLENGCSYTVTKEINGGLSSLAFITAEYFTCDSLSGSLVLEAFLDSLNVGNSISQVEWLINTGSEEISLSGNPVSTNLQETNGVIISAVVTLDNGCQIELESTEIIDGGSLVVEIVSDINICLGNSLLVEFTPAIIQNPFNDPLSYSWDISVNGVESNSSLQTLILQLNESDSLHLVLNVSSGDLCEASDSLNLVVSDLLPHYEIVKTLTDCGDPNQVSISLSDLISGPDLGIDSESWTVVINGEMTNYDSSPIDLELDAQDSVDVFLQLEYVNGCDGEFECSFAVTDILPEASFEYTIENCDAEDTYQVSFVNTSVLEGQSIESINWSITIDNSNQLFDTPIVDINIPVGAYVLVELVVVFDNGCTATVSEEFENFNAIPELDILASIEECGPGGVLVSFLLDDYGFAYDSIVWNVVNGTTNLTLVGDSVQLVINDEISTSVSAEVYLSNTCVVSVNENYDNGVLPDLIIEGAAVQCGEQFYVCYEASIPDSVLNLDIITYNWTVTVGGNTLTFDTESACFETSSLTGFIVELTAETSNGCTLMGVSQGAPEVNDFDTSIVYELLNCEEEDYNVLLYNDLGMIGVFDSIQYEWIININGDDQFFNTDSVNFILESGDTLIAISNVSLGENCMSSDTLEITADGMLPSAEIQVDLIQCLSPFSFEVEVYSIDSFPSGFVVDSISWTVNDNGVISNFSESPFTLLLNLNSDVSITYEVFFSNGCSIIVEELINPSDLLPEATFEVEGLNCEADSTHLDILIYNTTFLDSVEIEELEWLIVVDGMTMGFEGDSITLTVPIGSIITVSNMVDFANGCTVTGIESVLIEKPTLEFTADPIITCGETNVPLLQNPNPDWTYDYMPEDGLVFINADSTNPFVVVDTFMTYVVTVDNGICTLTDTVDVFPYLIDTIDIIVLDTLCLGEATLYVDNPDSTYSYEWSDDPSFENIIGSGDSIIVTDLNTTYYVQFLSQEDCLQGQGEVFIGQTILDITAPQPMQFCDGDTLIYNIINNDPSQELTVLWNDDVHILTPLDSSEIEVTIFPGEESFVLTAMVSNQYGCDSLLMVNFEAGDSTELGFTYNIVDCGDLTICFTQDPLFNGSVFWDFGDNSTEMDTSSEANPCYTYPALGNYTVSLSSTELTCMPEPYIEEITVFDELLVLLDADTTLVLEGQDATIFVSNPEDGWEYDWSTGEAGSTITVSPEETQVYSVTVTDENGCQGIGLIEIEVIPFDCDETDIFLPNAFSPNGDGINDILYVRSNGVDNVLLVIYNRWGEKVFETEDITVGWDGRFNSKPLHPDAYGYYLRAECIGGEVYETKGNVSIIK